MVAPSDMDDETEALIRQLQQQDAAEYNRSRGLGRRERKAPEVYVPPPPALARWLRATDPRSPPRRTRGDGRPAAGISGTRARAHPRRAAAAPSPPRSPRRSPPAGGRRKPPRRPSRAAEARAPETPPRPPSPRSRATSSTRRTSGRKSRRDPAAATTATSSTSDSTRPPARSNPSTIATGSASTPRGRT